MKKFLLFLFAFLTFSLLIPKVSFAITCYEYDGAKCSPIEKTDAEAVASECMTFDACNTEPTPIESSFVPGADDNTNTFTLAPVLKDIDDTTPTVSVQFNDPDLLAASSMFVCLEQDMCIDNDDIRKSLSNGEVEAIDKATRGLEKSDVDEKTIERYKLVNGKIVVCGDGPTKLRGSKEYFGASSQKGCDDSRDYFHAGNIYLLTAYEKLGDVYILRSVGGFYVNHHMPSVSLSKTEGLVPGDRLTVSISTNKLKNGGDKRNNYRISIAGPGILATSVKTVQGKSVGSFTPTPKQTNTVTLGNGEKCVTLKNTGSNQSVELPISKEALTAGRYTVRVSEQINEGGTDPCQQGFVYFQTECRVAAKSKNNNCTNPKYDPENRDFVALYQLFASLGERGPGTKLPCKEGQVVENPLDCPEIETAIGSIPIDPIGFAAKLFSMMLSLAGIAALFLIIYSGYRLMLSRGNKEGIQAAREMLTAAVIGLLFIVFSLVILNVIGVDILRLPGFGK